MKSTTDRLYYWYCIVNGCSLPVKASAAAQHHDKESKVGATEGRSTIVLLVCVELGFQSV
jgi:hypothetical protein